MKLLAVLPQYQSAGSIGPTVWPALIVTSTSVVSSHPNLTVAPPPQITALSYPAGLSEGDAGAVTSHLPDAFATAAGEAQKLLSR